VWQDLEGTTVTVLGHHKKKDIEKKNFWKSYFLPKYINKIALKRKSEINILEHQCTNENYLFKTSTSKLHQKKSF